MKLRSYTLLFRLFSFLSDKTNGASFFVKYKLLLGTLIMGLISASACKAKKEVMCYVQIEEVPLTEKATSCYDSIVVKPNSGIINIKGTVTDKSGEPIADVSVVLKNSTKGTLTDMKGKFTLNALPTDSLVFSYIGFLPQTIFVSQIKENKVIILEEEDTILCYEVVVVEAKPFSKNSITCYVVSQVDDTYIQTGSKSFSKSTYLYAELQTPPISPVGNLEEFKKWIERNIIYNKRMRKNKIQGQLILNFIVDENGNIVDRKILSKLSPDADAEALRILLSSDKWIPGMQNGKAIKTIISIPINF